MIVSALNKKRRQLSQGQSIAMGFLIIILIGSLLLMLPFASRSGQITPWFDCLFTATSATCVTGLVVVDTWTHWSVIGQLLILIMIQIGGLGFITLGVGVSVILRRRIGIRQRSLMQESVNVLHVGGVVRLAKHIIVGSFIVEGIGALLLSIRFIPELGFLRGLYYGVFHAVSAYCNAGFDLMGFKGEYASLVSYSNDLLVNLVIMALIIIGGIGFMVWEDLYLHKWNMRRYTLHTKIVLTTTAALLVGGTLLFLVMERHGLFADMEPGERILAALFSSVTARTAGFNTVDTGALSPGSKLLTIILMFIGGSPGSTAGGIKTTTIVVILLYMYATIRGKDDCVIFKRQIDPEDVRKATVVATLNLFLAISAMLLITAAQTLPFEDIAFEVFSAIGTVGMSSGITRSLRSISRAAIIILMYGGRVGSMSFALSFLSSKHKTPVSVPKEGVPIG